MKTYQFIAIMSLLFAIFIYQFSREGSNLKDFWEIVAGCLGSISVCSCSVGLFKKFGWV